MIHRLDAYDLWFECVLMLVHVPEKVELGRPRTYEENRFGSFEASDDLVKEALRIVGVVLFALLSSRMLVVNVVQRCDDRRFLAALRVKGKNASFLVIDPHHDVLAHDETSPIGVDSPPLTAAGRGITAATFMGTGAARSGRMSSIGIGNTMVEFWFDPMSSSVCM